MPKICYTPKRFAPSTLATIERANVIVEEYQAMNLALTLRQLYYQFVARDWIPNTFRSYKNLQSIINDARLAGEIDWHAIEDRTRNLVKPASWDSPQEILDSCAYSFRRNLWENQPRHVEVWVEKDALLAVVEKACRRWRTPYFSCRGYVSQSEVWTSAMRLKRKEQECVILHLGDHDPSGVDMSRDIQDRMEVFGAGNVEVRRIALTMTQVRALNPPPNPAKITDSRAPGYVSRFGHNSWELDALNPPYLIDLIETHTRSLVDEIQWEEDAQVEAGERDELSMLSTRYQEAIDHLNSTDN